MNALKEDMSKATNLKRLLEQTGKRGNISRDRKRQAFLPGQRVSRFGNIYWETRRNRTDSLGKDI